MTGPHDDTPARRATDQGALGKARAWWRKWGQLIIGVSVLALAIATFAIGLEVRAYSQARAQDAAAVRLIASQQAAQQQQTAHAAKVSCQRSMQYGHALADFFERERVLSPAAADAYRASIPKSCPK